jgi:hypothetical protein
MYFIRKKNGANKIMKKSLIIFLAICFVFAQVEENVQAEIDSIAPSEVTDTIQQIAEIDTTQGTEKADSIDIKSDSLLTVADTNEVSDTTDTADTVKTIIFFAGVQTGDIPELRETLENAIRKQWSLESNTNFVNPSATARILRKLFNNGKIVIDSTFYTELAKQALENSVILLIDVDNYSVKPVRRLLVGAGVEGKLKADFLFFDAASRKPLFAAKLSSTALVKKTPIWWRSLQERVTISAEDLRNINSDLLDDIIKQGFEAMKIAVSSKK